ncbi:uncharacterized protein MKZ38_002827 [Zalerion maritima]|uniref:Uridylate kinase n=1 Tax=Zalerion maritima TaxID=339359 RepID=A0AAD5RNE3_9PEZI|nr:uncharacterized protein MKZ38_002827 [Zalerion maritima]
MCRLVLLRQFIRPTTTGCSNSSTPLPQQQLRSSSRAEPSLCARRSLHVGAASIKPKPSTPISRTARPATLRPQQQQSRQYSGIPPPNGSVKFWPFFLIIGVGSLGYYMLAQKRHDILLPHFPNDTEAAQQAVHKHQPSHSSPNFPAVVPRSSSQATKMPPVSTTRAFSASDVTVIFVLGGPGAGKGTQSHRLVETYGFTHLSAGDLLRAEQKRPGSEFGELISQCIREGAIVPMEVTVKLLENAMRDSLREKSGKEDVSGVKGKFLVDGFPRKMDQALKFEQTVCPARFVLFYDCPAEELEKRLLERGKTSGRTDDNPESIRKRFATFVETSMPVVDHYEKEGRVVKITATTSIDDVFKETQKQLTERLGDDL